MVSAFEAKMAELGVKNTYLTGELPLATNLGELYVILEDLKQMLDAVLRLTAVDERARDAWDTLMAELFVEVCTHLSMHAESLRKTMDAIEAGEEPDDSHAL